MSRPSFAASMVRSGIVVKMVRTAIETWTEEAAELWAGDFGRREAAAARIALLFATSAFDVRYWEWCMARLRNADEQGYAVMLAATELGARQVVEAQQLGLKLVPPVAPFAEFPSCEEVPCNPA